MGILYFAVTNKNGTFVVQGLGTKQTGNFNQIILQYKDKFKLFGRQSMAIDSERTMTYRDEKEYSISCVHSSYEIKEMEA